MTKIPQTLSKIKISLEFAVLKVIWFETVTQVSRSINPDVFVDNMKRNSDFQNTWSSCVIQMLKRQTQVKGAVISVSLSTIRNLKSASIESYWLIDIAPFYYVTTIILI